MSMGLVKNLQGDATMEGLKVEQMDGPEEGEICVLGWPKFDLKNMISILHAKNDLGILENVFPFSKWPDFYDKFQ
jgi:hypothetical protein